MYEFRIDIEPIAKGRPRFTRTGIAYTPPRTKLFERDCGRLLKIEAMKFPHKFPMSGAIEISVAFALKRPVKMKSQIPLTGSDLDNFLKSFMDSANGILWHDDAQVIRVTAEKGFCDKKDWPHIFMTIEPMGTL